MCIYNKSSWGAGGNLTAHLDCGQFCYNTWTDWRNGRNCRNGKGGEVRVQAKNNYVSSDCSVNVSAHGVVVIKSNPAGGISCEASDH
ncbi:MAG: hypothetical protein KDI42_10395 [Gammaproteobacteria bacterium]|nr:hypothetical protein [Gammaproteobacteria bacterium]